MDLNRTTLIDTHVFDRMHAYFRSAQNSICAWPYRERNYCFLCHEMDLLQSSGERVASHLLGWVQELVLTL